MTGAPKAFPVQTMFLGWNGPALQRAARAIGNEHAGPDGLDLRGVVVVIPAARAGRRLAELLLEEAEARGLPLTPPRTVTIGHFPELLYESTGPLADPTISRHAFSRALRTLDPGLLEEVFPHPPANASGWMALAGMVESLHKELGAAGLDFRQVAGEVRKGFPFDDSARWEALGEVQDAYLKVLQEAGVRDRDRERKRALDEGRLIAPGEIWMVGVVELPRMVRDMMAALPGPIRALVHAPEDIRERFDAFGCVLPDAWRTADLPVEDQQVRVVQHPRDQAAATASALAGFGGRFAAEDVVVGVPDAELIPFVERGLSGAGVRHRFAGGTPLRDTGPVRLLQALGEYLDGRPYPAFAALIRHPDLHEMVEAAVKRKGDSSSGESGDGPDWDVTGALTDVDQFQSRHLQDTLDGPLPREDKYVRRTRRLVVNLEEALGLKSLEGTRPLSGWMPDVLEVLVKVYGGRPLDRSKPMIRDMVDAVTRIKGAATRLATLPRALDAEVGASEAMATLMAELTGPDMTLAPDPQEHAVELLGWLELPLDDAPAVIVTGVNERVLPEAVGADPFLPGALRTRLGIVDDEARYARDAYLLSALLKSREEVQLVAGRLTAQGDPLRPSRLLFAVGPEDVARRIRRYLGDVEEGDGKPGIEGESPEPGVPGTDAEPRSQFRSPPQDPIRAKDPLTRIRVTDFATYLKDPYRYALDRVLNLESLDDSAREMGPMVFGNLAHEVLERFGKSQVEDPSQDANTIAKELGLLLDRAVRDEFGFRPVPAVRVQVEQLRARLRRFARWQAQWVAGGWRVMLVEHEPDPGVSFDVDGQPVLLRGKIDRIDHNPLTGEWAIFDYKTGDTGKAPDEVHRKGRKNQKEWVDLQLPLYRVLLQDIKKDGSPFVPEAAWKDVKLGYILLPKELDKVREAVASWTEDELAEAEEVARRVIREIRTNEFHYDPDTRSFRDDALDALRGRLELPRADDGEEGVAE